MANVASTTATHGGRRAIDLGPLGTLARRRFQLTARTPRELVVPLLTPILFALVIAPDSRPRFTPARPTSPSWPSAPLAC